MDRIFALVILLLAHGYSNASSSTVVYPTFGGLSQTVVNGQPSYGAKTGARALSNGTIRFPIGGKLFAGLNPSQAEGIGNAITAKGIVNQASVKALGVTALRTLSAAALPTLALAGLAYVLDHYEHTTATATYNAWDTSGNTGTGASPTEACIGLGNPNAVGDPDGKCRVAGLIRGSWSQVGGSQTQTVTEPEAQAIAQQNASNFSQAEIQALIDAGWIVPLETAPNTVIGDYTDLTAQEIADLQDMGFFQPTPGVGALPVGDPVTDPVTGQKTQPYVQLDPAPNAGVRVTPYEAPLNPDGTPATDPQGNPLPNQERNPDPCELDPERAGCSKLGDLDGEPPVPTQLNVSLNPMAGWDAPGACPADVVIDAMGQQIPFKFKGACDFFTMMRPVILAGAWIVATLIFVGGVRT